MSGLRGFAALRADPIGILPVRRGQTDLCEMSGSLLQAGHAGEDPFGDALCRTKNVVSTSLAGLGSSMEGMGGFQILA